MQKCDRERVSTMASQRGGGASTLAPKGLLPRPPRAAARGGAPCAEAQSKIKISKRKQQGQARIQGENMKKQENTELPRRKHENT